MDVNDLRIAVTLMSFAGFAGIVAWACARGNRHRFEADALIPFDGDEKDAVPDASRRGAST